MPYNPQAIGESDRSNQYRMMWVGAGGALFSFANLFVGMDNVLSAMAYGAMAGGPLSVAFGSRADEYLRSLMDTGLRWMSAVLGGYLMVLFVLASGDVANRWGYALGSGESRAPSGVTELIAMDGLLVAFSLSLVFYAGYAFQWVRDRFDGAEDET
jgi:hypothetical protein